MLAPAGTLRGVDEARIGLDSDRCREHARQIGAQIDTVRAKMRQVFTPPTATTMTDVDGMLYSGDFFSARDRKSFQTIRTAPADRLADIEGPFDDPRIPEMLFRYRARNWPDSLAPAERVRWERERLARLNSSDTEGRLDAAGFWQELEEARAACQDDRDVTLLDAVEDWGRSLLDRAE
jgi:exodeoxyribonuclease-1